MNNTWEQLDKLSELEEQARFDERNKEKHYDKHSQGKELGDNLFPAGMTPEEYDDAAHFLSSAPAKPLGTGKHEVMGYINQINQKIKIKHKDGIFDEFVVYVGDDITGAVVTYYIKEYPDIIAQANPFGRGRKERKYKCDLDGNFEGLKVFRPKKNMTQEEYDEIVYKIENDIPLWEE